MRTARYLTIIAALTITLSLSAVPREMPRDPGIIKKITRIIAFILQPLADYVSPPHP